MLCLDKVFYTISFCGCTFFFMKNIFEKKLKKLSKYLESLSRIEFLVYDNCLSENRGSGVLYKWYKVFKDDIKFKENMYKTKTHAKTENQFLKRIGRKCRLI